MLMIETPYKKCSDLYGPFLQSYTHTHFIVPTTYGINQSYCGPRQPYAWGAGAAHFGGCHILMGDGAVRFISETVSASTLQSLTSIAGTDILKDF